MATPVFPARRQHVRTFWLFALEVVARKGADPQFPVGSILSLQCVVPAYVLEDALRMLHSHLETEGFERIDLFIARRYDLDNPEEEYPSDYIKGDGELVVETGVPTTSLYITGPGEGEDSREH